MFKKLIKWYKKYNDELTKEIRHFLDNINKNLKQPSCIHKWGYWEQPGVIIYKCKKCGKEHKFKTDIRCPRDCK